MARNIGRHAPGGVLLPDFIALVARVERSETRGRSKSLKGPIPGFALLNPGYCAEHDRAKNRSHRRFRRDAMVLSEVFDALYSKTRARARRENEIYFTSPRRAGRGEAATAPHALVHSQLMREKGTFRMKKADPTAPSAKDFSKRRTTEEVEARRRRACRDLAALLRGAGAVARLPQREVPPPSALPRRHAGGRCGRSRPCRRRRIWNGSCGASHCRG